MVPRAAVRHPVTKGARTEATVPLKLRNPRAVDEQPAVARSATLDTIRASSDLPRSP
jgi:hypothetical protein